MAAITKSQMVTNEATPITFPAGLPDTVGGLRAAFYHGQDASQEDLYA
ncbi:MAG TPA: hypothetical protein VG944_07765 [Fimbriimonas sp.]|nr:hypothetical protein [Fimbriimonas sp.]